jgi:hypothetical protein
MDKGLPRLLGALGGLMILLGAVLSALGGIAESLLELRAAPFLHGLTDGFVLLVLGIIMLILTAYSSRGPEERGVAGGIVLLVLSGILLFLGFGSDVFVLVGAILGVLAGGLFAVESSFRSRYVRRPPPPR